MPRVDDVRPAPLGRRRPLELPVQDPLFFSEVLPAAFGSGNTAASFLNDDAPRASARPADPDFDPLTLVFDTPYEPHAGRFIGLDSARDVARLKAQIGAEEERRRTLDAAGWRGIVAAVIAGVFDPVNLIPVGGQTVAAVRGGASLLRTFGLTTRAGFIGSSAAEALLRARELAPGDPAIRRALDELGITEPGGGGQP